MITYNKEDPSLYISLFFAYARERYSILLRRRRGMSPPWTEDPVLQQFSFCNIFREDDKTTAWFRENIRIPLDVPDKRWAVNPHHKLILATVAFRWFNYIPTGEALKNVLLEEGWNEKRVRAALRDRERLFTGAYIIMPRPGISTNKLDGVCWCMERFKGIGKHSTLEAAHADLMQSPGMGPFMAYEVITDLRHTHILHDATDTLLWANPGPGAKRGLAHVFGDYRPKEAKNTKQVRLILMQMLLAFSKFTTHWPSDWPPWDMRTVEHTLCEYDKYVRGRKGQRLKRKYRYEKS
jgi:hypothetical protein